MNQIYTLKISKAINDKVKEIFPKEYFEKYQIKLSETMSNENTLIYTMSSQFEMKDLAELNKKFKAISSEEKTSNIIFSIYDINVDHPISPRPPKVMYATQEELKQTEIRILAVVDAKIEEVKTELKAEFNAKIDATNAKIDANQAKTDAKIDKLTNILLDFIKSNQNDNGKK